MVHTTVVAAALLDGGASDFINSPFSIPVAGVLMVLGIVVANVWSGVRAREMRSQERLAAIAKGLPLPASLEEEAAGAVVGTEGALNTLERQRNSSRRAGMVLVFTGLGLVAFFVVLATVLRVRPVLSGAAAALIPAGIGLGFLVDARARTRDMEARQNGTPEIHGTGGSLRL